MALSLAGCDVQKDAAILSLKGSGVLGEGGQQAYLCLEVVTPRHTETAGVAPVLSDNREAPGTYSCNAFYRGIFFKKNF